MVSMKNKLPKLPANLRGKFVSRASFAKMQGEKQRLEKDIHTLVMSNDLFEIILLKEQYIKKFEKNKSFLDALRAIARKEWPKLQEK